MPSGKRLCAYREGSHLQGLLGPSRLRYMEYWWLWGGGGRGCLRWPAERKGSGTSGKAPAVTGARGAVAMGDIKVHTVGDFLRLSGQNRLLVWSAAGRGHHLGHYNLTVLFQAD